MKRIVKLGAASLLLLLAACNKDQVEEQPDIIEVSAEQVEEVSEEVQETVLPYITPFSGERVAEEPNVRPVLVTVNNHPLARPQSGLQEADVVYEMLAEGDVTRLLALYQSKLPENVGPVRSARDYFVTVAQGLDAFYIAHGYSPDAKSMLERRVVDNINGMHYDGSLFKRSTDRKAPHNSYISGENIVAGIEKVGASILYQKKVSYPFYQAQDNVKIGVQAKNLAINYSNSGSFNSEYKYNEETNRYTKYAAGTETVDYDTKESIAIANVLFFEMPHRVIDNEGRRSIDISASGKAYVFQAGTMREVQWQNQDGLLVAVEADGSGVQLVPGKTWVHFVPTTPGLAASVTYE